MIRRLFTFAAVLSLLLCAVTAAFWAMSYSQPRGVSVERWSRYSVESRDGGLILSRSAAFLHRLVFLQDRPAPTVPRPAPETRPSRPSYHRSPNLSPAGSGRFDHGWVLSPRRERPPDEFVPPEPAVEPLSAFAIISNGPPLPYSPTMRIVRETTPPSPTTTPIWSCPGVNCFRGSQRSPHAIEKSGVRLSDWLIVCVTAILPAFWLHSAAKVWRREHRRGEGHCTTCGYDLRATPGRCPECGRDHAIPKES